MAENETLIVDGKTASRWTPIQQRIASGDSPLDCFEDIEEHFYKSLRVVRRDMAKCGVTLERLLSTALNRPDELEAVVRQTRNQVHACLLLDIVRCQSFLSLEQLTLAWLSAVWDSVHDLLQLDLSDHAPNAAFDGKIRVMLNRLARLIAQKPTRIPNLPRCPKDPPDDLDRTLGQSIL